MEFSHLPGATLIGLSKNWEHYQMESHNFYMSFFFVNKKTMEVIAGGSVPSTMPLGEEERKTYMYLVNTGGDDDSDWLS